MKYTDANARAAIATEDLYYTKSEVDALLNAVTIAASQVTSGIFVDARIPNLNASKTTAGTFSVARIPDINASKIIAGAFRSGAWTVLGGSFVLQNGTSLGVDGNFNLNGVMDLSSAIPIDAGAGVLRLTSGFGVRRSS